MFERPQPLKPPPPDRAFLRAFIHFLLFAALLAGGWYWKYGREESDADETAAVTAAAIPGAPGAPAPVPAPPKPVEWIKLDSTDGRTIRAEILVISDSSVFIRREDGQKFDLPFTRLTPESKQRIMDAREKLFGAK